MDITQLYAFVTVAREGNLSRAAALLHVAQPAVSLQIKSLQSSLNLQLFTRIPSNMTLTDDSIKLPPFAERTTAAVSQLRQQADSLHSNSS
ncbi:regulatory helix-turn-helix protein, lysR family [Collimonas sp. OK242]|nr:regulatory helix-turn-helix protein, lysR family [Collimonas sp. OK242]